MSSCGKCLDALGHCADRIANTWLFLVFQDVSVQLKSLFSSIATLLYLNDSHIISCSDLTMSYLRNGTISIQASLSNGLINNVYCQPRTDVAQVHRAFLVMVLCNQLVFIAAIVLKHTRWLAKRSAFISYSLAASAFILCFGKILVVFYTTILDLYFSCDAPSIDSLGCTAKTVTIDIQRDFDSQCTSSCSIALTCANACLREIPLEVLLLVSTYVLSFIYIAYLAYEYHSGYRNPFVDWVESQQQVVPAAADAENADDSSSSSSVPSSYTALLASSSSSSSSDMGNMIPPPLPHDTIALRQRPGTAATAASSASSSSSLDHDDQSLVLHPTTSSTTTSQQPLLDRRGVNDEAEEDEDEDEDESQQQQNQSQHLSASSSKKRMGSERFWYRVLRDLAALSKFIITFAAIALVLLNDGPTALISCNGATVPLAGGGSVNVAGKRISSACNSQVGSSPWAYLFVGSCFFASCFFIFSIIVDKKPLVPSRANFVVASLFAAILGTLLIQVSSLAVINELPPIFTCLANYGVAEPTSVSYPCSERALQPSELGLPLDAGTVSCAEQCTVRLPSTVFFLTANLGLSFVYAVFLALSYRRQAKAMLKRDRQRRLRRLAAPDLMVS